MFDTRTAGPLAEITLAAGRLNIFRLDPSAAHEGQQGHTERNLARWEELARKYGATEEQIAAAKAAGQEIRTWAEADIAQDLKHVRSYARTIAEGRSDKSFDRAYRGILRDARKAGATEAQILAAQQLS